MASSPITSWQADREKTEVVTDFLLLASKITADGDYSHEIRRQLLLGRKAMTNLNSVLKSRDISLPTKVHIIKAMVFPVVTLWELYHKEGRMPKNSYLWTVVLEKTPESPLDSKETKPVNLNEDQPWIDTERTDAESEAPAFWSSDVNNQLIGKVPDAGKDLREEGEGGIRGWDGWTALLIQWTWAWPKPKRWWGPGRPGLLGLQRVWHNWATEQQQQSISSGRLYFLGSKITVDSDNSHEV